MIVSPNLTLFILLNAVYAAKPGVPKEPTSLQENSREVKGPQTQEPVLRAGAAERGRDTNAIDGDGWS